MSEFLIREENFSLGILDRISMPDANECFLLYQVGKSAAESFVVYSGMKYSSTEIRHGHYNRKAVISLKTKELKYNQQMVMENQIFYFDVMVKISYLIQDVQKYFFGEKIEEEDIKRIIRKSIKRHDGEWDIQQRWKAENSLQEEIEEALRQHKGVRFIIQEVKVNLDEDAKRIMQSDKDKIVGIHVNKNETDEQIAKNDQKQKIIRSEHEITAQQIELLAMMTQNFGSLAPIVEEYFEKNISGIDLYEYIVQAKANDMSMLHTALTDDMLTQEEVFHRLNKILNDDKISLKTGKQEQLVEKKTEVEEKLQSNTDEKFIATDGDFV